jgi:hypothetical protein
VGRRRQCLVRGRRGDPQRHQARHNLGVRLHPDRHRRAIRPAALALRQRRGQPLPELGFRDQRGGRRAKHGADGLLHQQFQRSNSNNWTGNANNVFTSLATTITAGNIATFYAQGANTGLPFSGPGGNITSYNTNDNVIIAGNNSTTATQNFVGFVFYGAQWARSLGIGEVLDLHQNPWGTWDNPFLIWPEETIAAFTSLNLIAGNQNLPLEGLAIQLADIAIRAEILARQQGDQWADVEWLGATGVIGDAIVPIESLGTQRGDANTPAEALAGLSLGGEFLGNIAASDTSVPVETLLTVIRGWGRGAAASIVRRFSRPGVATRVRRLFFPGHPGSFAIEELASQRADPGAPAEALATQRADPGIPGEFLGVWISVAGDSVSPVEVLVSQWGGREGSLENAASLRIDPVVPAEGLGAEVRDSHGPVEALAGGMTTIGDATLALQWVGAAYRGLVSLESGPERIRLLATRGRVRLLRRN